MKRNVRTRELFIADDMQSTIADYARLAADQYDRDAKLMAGAGQARLQAQFEVQAETARRAARFFDGEDL